MDFHHFIHGFTKLSTTTVNGYCYRYAINDHHSLAMPFQCIYCYVAQICTPSCLLGVHIHSNPSLLLLLILPMQNNKSVKAPFTRDVWKNTVLGVGSHANTALSFALCCICNSTPPLILYFSCITHNGAFTYTYAYIEIICKEVLCKCTHI